MAFEHKTEVIDFIASQFNKGIFKRNVILQKVAKKWTLPIRTFDRFLTAAKEVHASNRKQVKVFKEELLKTETQVVVIEEKKREILNKAEAMEILTMIAKGQKVITRIKSGVLVRRRIEGTDQYEDVLTDVEIKSIPSPAERRAAIETLAKMEGWNEPDRVINAIVTNNEIDLSQYTDAELAFLIKLQSKSGISPEAIN